MIALLFGSLISQIVHAETFIRCSIRDSQNKNGAIEFTREELHENKWWISRQHQLSTGQRLQIGAFLLPAQASLYIQVFDPRLSAQPIISQVSDLNAPSPRVVLSIAGLADIDCK